MNEGFGLTGGGGDGLLVATEASTAVDARQTATDPPEEVVVTPDPEAPTFTMPEKFKGKSVEDVAAAYVGLETHIGELGRQITQLRTAIQQAQQQVPEPAKETPTRQTVPVAYDGWDEARDLPSLVNALPSDFFEDGPLAYKMADFCRQLGITDERIARMTPEDASRVQQLAERRIGELSTLSTQQQAAQEASRAEAEQSVAEFTEKFPHWKADDGSVSPIVQYAILHAVEQIRDECGSEEAATLRYADEAALMADVDARMRAMLAPTAAKIVTPATEKPKEPKKAPAAPLPGGRPPAAPQGKPQPPKERIAFGMRIPE